MARLSAPLLALLALLAKGAAAPMVSVCGDPGMTLPPKILLEGWNFCNRAGRACSVAPRWADCVAPNGTQRVSPAANAAGLAPSAQNQAACDAFTEQKERDLGGLCVDGGGAGNASAIELSAPAVAASPPDRPLPEDHGCHGRPDAGRSDRPRSRCRFRPHPEHG